MIFAVYYDSEWIDSVRIYNNERDKMAKREWNEREIEFIFAVQSNRYYIEIFQLPTIGGTLRAPNVMCHLTNTISPLTKFNSIILYAVSSLVLGLFLAQHSWSCFNVQCLMFEYDQMNAHTVLSNKYTISSHDHLNYNQWNIFSSESPNPEQLNNGPKRTRERIENLFTEILLFYVLCNSLTV